MNSILSTVSGYFSKSLILGAFLPAVIFISAFVLFVYPLLPDDLAVLHQLSLLDTEWKFVSASFATVVLSGLLYFLNNPLIRVYEGYPWRNTWPGKWLTRRKVERYQKLNAQQNGMTALLRSMKSIKDSKSDKQFKTEVMDSLDRYLATVPRSLKKDVLTAGGGVRTAIGPEERWSAYYSAIRSNWSAVRREILNEFPGGQSFILPTRLGNVVRSFEYYSNREYGIDAIPLYPRLVAKIDKDYAAVIDDAKIPFDFMINCSALGAVFLVSLVIAGISFGRAFESSGDLAGWLLKIGSALLIVYLAYRGAINRATDWGETVKSAFDLYRNALLQQLGFSSVPSTKKEERDVWRKISQQMIYGDSFGEPRIDYSSSASLKPTELSGVKATGTPPNVTLTIFKGFRSVVQTGVYQVVLRVSNADEKTDVKAVTVSDIVPDGWLYRAGSGKSFGAGTDPSPTVPAVSGSNPYHFQIGDLNHLEQRTITYEILPLVTSNVKGAVMNQYLVMNKQKARELIYRSIVKALNLPPIESSSLDLDETLRNAGLATSDQIEAFRSILLLETEDFIQNRYYNDLLAPGWAAIVSNMRVYLRSLLILSADTTLHQIADIVYLSLNSLPGVPTTDDDPTPENNPTPASS